MLHLQLSIVAVFVLRAQAQELAPSLLQNVKERLADGARQSWELGTRAQALTEYDAAPLSVFAPGSIPPSSSPKPLYAMQQVFDFIRPIVATRPADGQLMQDGSAADPASLGVAVVLAGATNQSGADWKGAAKAQVDYLLNNAPRMDDGAISHRTDRKQFWSDAVYMFPPFLAYYGAVNNNRTVIDEAYNQCKLYRDRLHDNSGMWKHIDGEGNQDDGHWATGNGWAAMGMLRVSATIAHSTFSNDMGKEKDDLNWWVSEILDGMYSHLGDDGLFKNYPDDDKSFTDASSTALIAAATYRLALLGGRYKHLPDAEKSRKALSDTKNNHFDQSGWLQPVVNPHDFPNKGAQSPEGQAFVLMMQKAYLEWKADGSKGAQGAALRGASIGLVPLLASLAASLWAMTVV